MRKDLIMVAMTQEEYDDARCPVDNFLMEWVLDETNPIFSSATHCNWTFYATQHVIDETSTDYVVVEVKEEVIPEPQEVIEDIPPPPDEPPPPP